MSIEFLPDSKKFIIDILNEKANDFIIEIADKFKQGEGFMGELFTVTLTNKKNQEQQHIIIKQQLCKNGEILEYTYTAFENEIYFYKTVWPKLYQMYKDKTGKSLNFVPNCLGVSCNGIMRLALENLTIHKFNVYEKTKDFDEQHFSLIFKTFGIYHALSMIFKHLHKDEYQQLVRPLHSLRKEDFKNDEGAGESLKLAALEVQNFFDPLTEDHLIEQLRLYERDGSAIMYNTFTQDEDESVVLHGDGWSNNMMFKYDETGKLQDIKLLDFQFVSTGSPVYDLSYCFYTGSTGDTLDKLEHFLKIYHASLSETLKNFNLDADKIYSFNSLKKEWKKFCKFGFGMGIILWSIKLLDRDFSEAEEEDVNKPLKIGKDKEDEYKQRVRELVYHMYKNDYF